MKNFNLKSLKTKILYKCFVNKTALPTKSKEGLTSEFQILDEEWKNIYCLSGKTNVNKKTQELQYRILNNYLNTNVRLKKLGVINDDTCSFCKQVPETLEHLLITCKHMQKFWKDLLGWYQQFSKEEISINLRTTILGWRTVDPPNLDNYILLSAKSLIYNCKISCNLPALGCLKKVVIPCFLVERFCYINYKKNESSLNKWSVLKFSFPRILIRTQCMHLTRILVKVI